MSEDVESRLARVERRLRATQVVAACALVAVAICYFSARSSAPRELTMTGSVSRMKLTGDELQLGASKLESTRLSLYTPVTVRGGAASATVRADQDMSYLALNYSGTSIGHGIENDSAGSIWVTGRVRTRILFNTETGALTLERSFRDQPDRVETKELLPPLSFAP